MAITRRQLLAATAALGTAAVVGAGGVVYSWWDNAPGEDLKTLSPYEHGIVQALAEAWMPRGGTPEPSGADVDCGGFFDQVLHTMGGQNAKLLKLLLHALDDLTLPTRFGRFSALPLEARTEVLDGWLNHAPYLLRQGVNAVMALISIGYTSHPDIAPFFAKHYRCGYGR